jgi:hypothetical protein
MWFKTRTGLVCVEGTVEVWADRHTSPGGRKAVGIYAYQARHAEFEVPLHPTPVKVSHRRIYLVCFPDGPAVDSAVAEAMQRIEWAIRNGEPICDLSDLGEEEAWGSADYVWVRWHA